MVVIVRCSVSKLTRIQSLEVCLEPSTVAEQCQGTCWNAKTSEHLAEHFDCSDYSPPIISEWNINSHTIVDFVARVFKPIGTFKALGHIQQKYNPSATKVPKFGPSL